MRTFVSGIGFALAILAAALFVGGVFTPTVSEAAMTSASPTVKAAQDAKLGTILTDSQGMTLYIFKKDKPGESRCEGTCAKNWPPLTVAEGMKPVAGPQVSGKLGEIERPDHSYQVTYDGMPLYRYVGDTKPGDTNGQGIIGAWFAASASGSKTSMNTPATKAW
jgi:predicted lipoprotein with Yx(FWY)xxD motif